MGFHCRARLDTPTCKTGRKITAEEKAQINLQPHRVFPSGITRSDRITRQKEIDKVVFRQGLRAVVIRRAILLKTLTETVFDIAVAW
jgi:hypothetical protein